MTTILPDGSACFVGSMTLPKDHWLYEPRCRRRDDVRDVTADTPHPILTRDFRNVLVVQAAARWAIRGATMNGTDMDFDPDALVKNFVYALCGPFNPNKCSVGETE